MVFPAAYVPVRTSCFDVPAANTAAAALAAAAVADAAAAVADVEAALAEDAAEEAEEEAELAEVAAFVAAVSAVSAHPSMSETLGPHSKASPSALDTRVESAVMVAGISTFEREVAMFHLGARFTASSSCWICCDRRSNPFSKFDGRNGTSSV